MRLSSRTCGRLAGLAAIVFALVALVAPAAFALTPEPVLTSRLDEFEPGASDGYLAWTGNTADHPRHTNIYVRALSGGKPIRVNERGTHGLQSSIDGTTVLYARATREEASDLRLYDVRTGERTAPGDRVNTRYWEFQPNISGRYYFFERGKFRGPTQFTKAILYDRRTGRSTVLADVDPRNAFLNTDQINGDWLVWEFCNFTDGRYTDCDVFRYQISTGHTFRVPNPGVQQYSPGVTSDGTVYYVRNGQRSHWKCGAHARIVRYPVGGPATVVASIPSKWDAFTNFALEGAYGVVTDYFDESRCSNLRSDIYKIDDVPAG